MGSISTGHLPDPIKTKRQAVHAKVIKKDTRLQQLVKIILSHSIKYATTTTPTMTKKTCPKCGHIQNVKTAAKRTVCSMCDSAIKLRSLVAIMATVLMLTVVPAAYADIIVVQENLTPEEQKVLDEIAAARADGTYIQPPEAEFTANIQIYSEDVVIPAPFPVSEWYCGDRIFKMGIPEMTCVVVGKAPTDSIWNELENKWVPESVIAEQAMKQEIKDKAMALTDDEKKLQGVENLVNKLKLKSNPTATDLQVIEHFDSFSICMRGLEDTEAFQTRNTFVVPVDALELVDGQWILVIPELDDGNFDFGRNSGIAGDLYIAGEECKAQMKLMGYTTPDHYRNMVMNEADFQPYHADQASLTKGIEAFGTDFTNRNDGDLTTEAAKSGYALCLNEHFSDKYKKDQGCPSPYMGLYEPREPTGFIMDNTTPMIQHERHGIVCGLLPDNDHIVNDIHWDYMKDLEQRFNCSHWDRIQGIMLFDPLNWNQVMIDEQIAKYQESQE